MSRLLLENSNQVLPTTPTETLAFDWNADISSFQWNTPKAGKEVHLQVDIMTRFGHDDLPTRRLLFRKVIKGFDEKDFTLGQSEIRIQQLEAKLEQLQPKKRRKVQTSLNSKFVDTKAIKEAQILARDREVIQIDSESSIDSDSTEDCIEVEAL